MQKVALIGTGRLGSALAVALDSAGFEISDLVYRGSPPPAPVLDKLAGTPRVGEMPDLIEADIIFITTQDPQIANVSHEIAGRLRGRPAVFHTSGSISSDILAELSALGCPIGSIHPLLSVSDPLTGAKRLSQAYFGIEGTEAAKPIMEAIVAKLGGRAFGIRGDRKALYHAGAVVASGHLAALIDAACEMLGGSGVDRDSTLLVLKPLIASTLENIMGQGIPRSLTGTYARGDADTFARHLAALDSFGEQDLTGIFLLLAARSLEIAASAGGARPEITELAERVSMAKRKRGW